MGDDSNLIPSGVNPGSHKQLQLLVQIHIVTYAEVMKQFLFY